MSGWNWVDREALLQLHDESLAEHGGRPGLRDEGLLGSALARPRNLTRHGEPDLADLAASYGVGLAKSHPFVDGNNRAAFLATGLCLGINGFRLSATQAEATVIMLEAAGGTVDEKSFAAWLRAHVEPRRAIKRGNSAASSAA